MKKPVDHQNRSLTRMLLLTTGAIGVGIGLFLWLAMPERGGVGIILASPAWAANTTTTAQSAGATPGTDVIADDTSDTTATSSTQAGRSAGAEDTKDEAAQPVFEPDPLAKLADSLKARERKLNEREAAVKKEEQRLEALRKETEQNLARIEQRLKEMQAIAGEAEQKHKQEISKWVNIYQAMPPEKAGPIIEGLESSFALELLSSMEPKKAGKILGNVAPQKAIELGKQLAPPRP